ncbi:ABC transporter ATP-binding protein [Halalkalibacillus halophilus]|uniref:ABC transporter ATP-binding protein n=1 Tax=Halalkalibacillus halophilus TaxID=392827 RepID=UPI00041E5893|nr:ATP-binding cassette domain-containing protein [Halalkalibacillus halophilus]
MSNIIEISNLSIKLKKTMIIEELNFSSSGGEIVGIVGKNGSGKSVLFKVISGLYRPDNGDLIVNGKNISSNNSFPTDFGALIENPGFLPNKSGFKNLKILSEIQKKISSEEIVNIIESVGLKDAMYTKVRNYSLGMKQRLGIAQAIMEKPKLVLLDEPTNGLDDEGTEIIKKLLWNIKLQGTTILLTSHNFEEIEELSDRIFRIERENMLQIK